MQDFDADTAVVAVAAGARLRRLRRLAVQTPWDGRGPIPHRQRLLDRSALDPDQGVSLLVSYDKGPHAVGWWRNSQYDECWHASIMCIDISDPARPQMADPDERIVRAWMRALFGDWMRHAWIEPPASPLDIHRNAPQSQHVTHVRIFTDRDPSKPITPTGEVYTLVPWADGTSPEKVFR